MPKYQTIIFDLGQVFVRFTPQYADPYILKKYGIKEGEARELFKSVRWHEYEKGVISDDEFFESLQAVSPAFKDQKEWWADTCRTFDLDKKLFDFFVDLRIEHPELEFWLLSNLNPHHHAYIYERWPGIFWSFWQVYLSYALHMRKPEPDIFRHVLKDGKASPYTAIFIDDLEENCAAAKKVGITPIRYTNADNLEVELKRLGISVEHLRGPD